MRVSSVISIFPSRSSIGTLKSTRTSTRLPRTSMSRTVSLGIIPRAPARNRAHARAMLRRIARFLFTQELRSSRKPLQHSHQHVNYSDELFFGGNNPLWIDKLAHCQHVQTRRAFERRTAGDFKKPGTIGR